MTKTQSIDVMTPAQRSHCMSQIRNKNTKPELLLRTALWRRGARYRLKNKVLGKPDIVFIKKRVAIFVDGCFWHGCPEHAVSPKTNKTFWKNKISKNKDRDKVVTSQLKADGWTVIRIWEHDIKANLNCVVDNVLSILEKH